MSRKLASIFFWLQWIQFPTICQWHILKRCQSESSEVKTKDLGSCFRGNLKKLDFWRWNASSLLICAEVQSCRVVAVFKSQVGMQWIVNLGTHIHLCYFLSQIVTDIECCYVKSVSHCSTDCNQVKRKNSEKWKQPDSPQIDVHTF